MVQHSFLWWASYQVLQPRWVHGPYMALAHALCARTVGAAFAKYDPDLIVSVHPLLQHVPVRVLAARIRARQQRPISFATVVTDFTTCHNTWFHRGVRAAACLPAFRPLRRWRPDPRCCGCRPPLCAVAIGSLRHYSHALPPARAANMKNMF